LQSSYICGVRISCYSVHAILVCGGAIASALSRKLAEVLPIERNVYHRIQQSYFGCICWYIMEVDDQKIQRSMASLWIGKKLRILLLFVTIILWYSPNFAVFRLSSLKQ
uniref:G_PROTEIN_RECEP_F1_2 domain-containing protein n=1 Tax=Ascaris lumbricoides TaxID=6252 RepID=A0A0M3IFG0_ASCLU